jgi:hypothetical protein
MSGIEVVAHGDRWAVRVGGDTRSEHLTRAEAELEARRLGAEPAVQESDPTGLAGAQDAADAAGGPDAGPSGAAPGELPRETQAGL